MNENQYNKIYSMLQNNLELVLKVKDSTKQEQELIALIVLHNLKKETAEVVIKMAALQNDNDEESSPNVGIGLTTVIIQPGYTLWAVARKTYGLGMQYVRIYHANKDQIKDPDMIFPGQVFSLPPVK